MTTTTLTLSEVLTHLLFAKRISPTELARLVGLSQPTIQRMVTGTTTNPHRVALQRVADFFQVSIEQLKGLGPISWLEPKTPEALGWSKVPLVTWAQTDIENAANGALAKDTEQLYTDAKVGARAFALTMKDASMEPQFPKETLLIIDPEKIPEDRSLVLAAFANHPEAVFRQLLINGHLRYLKPISPDFEQYKMSLMGENDKILGVLVQARRNYVD